jgi:signal transduction histidine kinase
VTIQAVTNQAATLQQRWTRWTARPILVDAALVGGAAILEVILELHDASMPWPPTLLAVRIPVIIAVIVFRRRWPLSMLVLAVADVVLQSEVSAALPIAAYALTRYRPQWSVRVPAIAAATVGTVIATTDTWGSHTGVIISVAFVLWPATLGAYVPARAQLVTALRERAERAEADQELRAQQAVFTERVRIAGEMHDVVGHRVSLMVLHAGAVEMAARDSGRVHVLAEQMQVAGRQALQELRQLVGLLRENDADEPAPLTPQPTLADLPAMVEESRLAGMDVTLKSTGQVRTLTEMVERAAYRIVQESLTNAGRHATGGSVCVTLDYRPTTLTVTVVNQKATGTANTVPGTGHGLLGLRERAHVLGGTLRADPRLDGGFAVEAVLPA